MSTKISIRQVELSNLVNNIEEVVKNVQILYKKLCDVLRFTQVIQGKNKKVLLDLKSMGHSMSMYGSSTSIHFNTKFFIHVL